MNLHNDQESFDNLVEITAQYIGIPPSAVKRDYLIVMLLRNLEQSDYADECVFKGGTSLSKCYPGSISRFSEDIDLTFVSDEDLSSHQYSKKLKTVESVMTEGFHVEPIPDERNDRNKSARVWHDAVGQDNWVKLEIGSKVRPDPVEKRKIKTYIQEYLEYAQMMYVIKEFELGPVIVNALCIDRTFVDKIMSVKRHAICGTLGGKVRHIYDVVKLFAMPEISALVTDTSRLKRIVQLTKKTDGFYLQKRNIPEEYNPLADYDFSSWACYFTPEIRTRYESLHEDLLYTSEKQDFDAAIQVFREIDNILKRIRE